LAALIEVGAGFHGDLTGRENIYLNGAILGMRRREICDKLDAIVGFAGLERFLDMPVKRYSSGMYARLGFSIASHVEPEVLLVDEVLSVGDAVFRLRCMDRMRGLVASGTTLIFVTHDLDQMQSICPRAIVLDGGRVAYQGPSRDAVGRYLHAMTRCYAHRAPDLTGAEGDGGASLRLADLTFLDRHGDEAVWVRSGESVHARVTLDAERSFSRLVIELNMRATVSENLVSLNSARDSRYFKVTPGRHRLDLTLADLPVAGGQYFWNVRAWDADSGATLLDTPFRYPLVIDDGGRATGALALDHEWRLESESRAGELLDRHAATSAPSDTAREHREDLPVC
jgi:ABC-type multidrug transport system ATPase subunit